MYSLKHVCFMYYSYGLNLPLQHTLETLRAWVLISHNNLMKLVGTDIKLYNNLAITYNLRRPSSSLKYSPTPRDYVTVTFTWEVWNLPRSDYYLYFCKYPHCPIIFMFV